MAVSPLMFLLLFVAANAHNWGKLEFEDHIFGTLIPCPYHAARGMICMKDNVDVIVWPNTEQSEYLKPYGIEVPSSKAKPPRVKRSWRDLRGTGLEGAGRSRQKRQGDFNFEVTPSVTSETHRTTMYDFQKILKTLIKNEWGLERPDEIDPTVKLWIENNVTLTRDTESGIYRALVAPSSQFDPDDNSGKKAVDVVKRLLSDKANKELWDWLDLNRIADEFELCYRTDYSTVANEDVRFDAPMASQLEFEKNMTGNESDSQSTLHFWYYKMSCLHTKGRIFLSMVIYTDKMEFEDVERTVDDWINTPETVVQWINETKQRIVATKKEVTVYDEVTRTGKRCHSVRGGTISGSSSNCAPYNTTQKIPKKLEVWEDKVLTDVTPKKFQYEVNRWRKYTKSLFVRRTITLKQRQALKSWIRNAMLANIVRNFGQFMR